MSSEQPAPGWWLASDGNWYPPQPGTPAPAHYPPPGWWRASDGNWYPPSASGNASARRDPRELYAGGAMVAGGAILAIASWLPWQKISAPLVGTVTRNGIDNGGDGWLTLILGVIVAGLGVVVLTRRAVPRFLPLPLAAAALLVALYDYTDDDRFENLATVGEGMWLVLIGAVVATAASIMYVALRYSNEQSHY